MRAHLTKCLLAGLVAVLPVGGLIFLVVQLERTLYAPLKGVGFYFPGMGIVAAIIVIYLLGLTVTTVVGRWLWGKVDAVLHQVPGLAILYATLKQILGYGSGKDALFHRVVLVKDAAANTMELGLVTEEVKLDGQPPRYSIFIPGSPNPALGRLVLVEPAHCIPTQIPVDVALKALLSTGKSGLQ
jgi:uncharacterized membrane protein